MSFLKVPLFTLISSYLLLHLRFCKEYQKCSVALIKITSVECVSNDITLKKAFPIYSWSFFVLKKTRNFWNLEEIEIFGEVKLKKNVPSKCISNKIGRQKRCRWWPTILLNWYLKKLLGIARNTFGTEKNFHLCHTRVTATYWWQYFIVELHLTFISHRKSLHLKTSEVSGNVHLSLSWTLFHIIIRYSKFLNPLQVHFLSLAEQSTFSSFVALYFQSLRYSKDK